MPRRDVAVLPGSAEHARLISPSKIPAILGISRWQSQYSLWHTMAGTPMTAKDGPQDIFEVGLAMELGMAELYKMRHPGWKLSRGEVQFIGDSGQYGFAYVCTLDRRASKGRARRVVEMKTARSMEAWGDEGTSDAPLDYTSQVLSQMLFSGYTDYPAHLVVLGPFFQEYVYEIPFDESVTGWILRRCQDFWNSLQTGVEPDLDDSISTYECVKAQHPNITAGLEREVPEALYLELSEAQRDAKAADALLRGLKTQVIDLIGDAQHGTVNGDKLITRRPGARGSVNLIIR